MKWRGHTASGQASCAAANTLFAVFSVSSPIGRIVDKFWFLNAPFAMHLEDLAYDCGVDPPYCAGVRPEPPPPSTVALTMIRDGLVSENRRKIPMTEQAKAALLSYYNEELSLLDEIETMLIRRRHISVVKKHRKAVGRVIEMVAGPGAAPGMSGYEPD
jgi:hypothetical protein